MTVVRVPLETLFCLCCCIGILTTRGSSGSRRSIIRLGRKGGCELRQLRRQQEPAKGNLYQEDMELDLSSDVQTSPVLASGKYPEDGASSAVVASPVHATLFQDGLQTLGKGGRPSRQQCH